MGIPALIPIAYLPTSRTPHVGRYADGQFFADQVPDTSGPPGTVPDRTAAVLHLFDHAGHHVRSTVVNGLAEDDADRAVQRLLDPLPGRVLGDIAVRLFETFEGGMLWALVDESGNHGTSDWAELYPQRLGFHAPWDGYYDT
jgi:hypothetical protein